MKDFEQDYYNLVQMSIRDGAWSYSDLIDTALATRGTESKVFIQAYNDSAEYARSNIGYFIGYFEGAERRRLNKIFNTAHPIFGKGY